MKEKKKIPFGLILIAVPLFILLVTFAVVRFFPASSHTSARNGLTVVFGAGITINSEPSAALRYRLDKAIECNKNGMILVSGRPPETHVMQRYLLRSGIPQKQILLDPEGENTAATIVHVQMLLRENPSFGKPVFISQRYHLPRIGLIALKKGLFSFDLVSADYKKIKSSSQWLFAMRESVAIYKSLILD